MVRGWTRRIKGDKQTESGLILNRSDVSVQDGDEITMKKRAFVKAWCFSYSTRKRIYDHKRFPSQLCEAHT